MFIPPQPVPTRAVRYFFAFSWPRTAGAASKLLAAAPAAKVECRKSRRLAVMVRLPESRRRSTGRIVDGPEPNSKPGERVSSDTVFELLETGRYTADGNDCKKFISWARRPRQLNPVYGG